MNFAEIMNSIGAESMGYAEPTLESELMEEIALESELDKNFAEMDAMNTVATVSEIEAVSIALSERELALESTGRTAKEVYKDFGLESVVALEAIKDVAARKYYGGVANLKALINKCIAWVKNLIGMGTSIKKVMTSLKKKADNQLKALRKLAGKNTDKLKRTMPEDNVTVDFENSGLKDKNGNIVGSSGLPTGDALVTEIERLSQTDNGGITRTTAKGVEALSAIIDALNTSIDDLKDNFKEWKEKDNEYEESAAYHHVIKLLESVKTVSNRNKDNKLDKDMRKMLDTLEKVRSKVSDKAAGDASKNIAANPDLITFFTKLTTLLNKKMTYNKDALKVFVKKADEVLTHGKGIEAALV